MLIQERNPQSIGMCRRCYTEKGSPKKFLRKTTWTRERYRTNYKVRRNVNSASFYGHVNIKTTRRTTRIPWQCHQFSTRHARIHKTTSAINIIYRRTYRKATISGRFNSLPGISSYEEIKLWERWCVWRKIIDTTPT